MFRRADNSGFELGVIKRVPENEEVTWCHRMVVSRKHDWSPRCTVDASRTYKHCRCDPYATESPFHVVCRVPDGTWNSVVDARNGYHSIPLRESNKNLTTFITPNLTFFIRDCVESNEISIRSETSRICWLSYL